MRRAKLHVQLRSVPRRLGCIKETVCRKRPTRGFIHVEICGRVYFLNIVITPSESCAVFYTWGQEGRNVRGFVSGLDPFTAVGLWLHSWDASHCSAVRALQAEDAQWILLTACVALLVSVAECTPVLLHPWTSELSRCHKGKLWPNIINHSCNKNK